MAEALLVVRIDSEGNLTVVKQAAGEIEKLDRSASQAAKTGLDELKKYAKLAASALVVLRTAQKGVELVKLGAQSDMATYRLEAFSGSGERATEMLDALRKASDYTIDRMTATSQAARLMQMGMVRNRQEMELTGAIVGRLGDQMLPMQTRMETWTLMLANQSVKRLDTFGMSIERIEARMDELEQQGYSTEEAFRAAVFEEGARALEVLGDTSESTHTQIQQLGASTDTLGQSLAETAAQIVTTSGIVPLLTSEVNRLNEAIEQSEQTADRVAAKAVQRGGVLFIPPGSHEAVARLRREYYALSGLYQDYAPEMERFDRILQNLATDTEEAADATRDKTSADEDALNIALAVMRIERQRSDALARLGEREEELGRRHQERLNEIYRSGEKSRTDILQEAYQEQLRALNERFAAEEEAYQARRAAERFATELRTIEHEHLSRVQDIRDQFRETERQAEDRRFREALEALEANQRERLRILRGESAGGGFESRREQLASEHEERMAGLYSRAARERERERYQEELAVIQREEDEYNLLQQFEKEKENLESEHQDTLQDIQGHEVQEQIRLEEQRYEEERRLARDRERERQQELDHRRDMERRQADERRRIEEVYQTQLSEVQRLEQAERYAQAQRDYERDLADLQRSRTDIEATYSESMSLLVLREMEGNAERRLAYARANGLINEDTLQWQGRMQHIMDSTAQHSLEMWQTIFDILERGPRGDDWGATEWMYREDDPYSYQHGTSFHPGGAAIVGEGSTRGELVVLPRGTQVYDAPTTERMMGGGNGQTLIIQNYFGRDAVRSERDIWEISRDQEMMLRRRGVRTFSTT